MKTQIHGVTSLGLILVANVMAIVTLFLSSWGWGVVYLGGGLAALGGILYAYCAKCPCRTHCGHVIPGKIVVALTNRQTGPYTPVEFAILGLALLWLIGLPQLWLWQETGLLVTFWVLVAVALVQIRTVVCRACDNVYCPARLRSRKV